MRFTDIVWLAAVIVFGITEAATVQLVSIWLAGGALIALIASILGASAFVQSVVFVLSSAVLLLLTRPLAGKMTAGKTEKTNADSLIGKRLVMTKSTDGLGENGEVKASGTVWTVRVSDGLPLAEGEFVTVEKIEGVKLIVKR